MASLWIPLLSQASIAATIVELSDARNFEIAEAYALVILDIYSAVADVLELIRQIRAETTVPILIIDTRQQRSVPAGSLQSGRNRLCGETC